jgi:Family of unknown function (DUF6092)
MLISSARGAPEEGAFTASLRLVDAAGRLADLPGVDSNERDRRFLPSLQNAVRDGMTAAYMESEEEYLKFLDRLVEMVADEARVRNGLA